MIRKRPISSSKFNNGKNYRKLFRQLSFDPSHNCNSSQIITHKYKLNDKTNRLSSSSSSVFSKNFFFKKNNSNKKFDILNLIIENNPNKYDVKKLKNKMKEINNLYSTNLKESFHLPKTSRRVEEQFYKYNILYGHNSSNLITTYSTKLSPMSSSINKFVKKMNLVKNKNIFVFTDDEVSQLLKAKCGDIGIEVKEHMLSKFKEYCNSKCNNRYVDLAENYLGLKSINFLGNILYNTDRISKLNLSKNNLGDMGAEILMNSIKNSKSLIYLNISSNGFTYKGGEVIFRNLINHQSLIDFNISTIEGSTKNRNRLTSVGIKNIDLYLKNNYLIEFFNLSGNSIRNEGFSLLCKGLNENHSINNLNIAYNEIEEKGIVQGLKFITTSILKLTFLDLSKNNIMNEGIIALTNQLKLFPNLLSLNLSFCGFEFKGFKTLLKSLQYSRKIECLNVSGNKLKSKNFFSLKPYFNFIGLKSLNMSKCHLCDNTTFELGDCLEQNCTLRKLNISHNEITDEGFKTFSKLFYKNNVLENFDCSSNFITDEGVKELIKSLEINTSLKSINFYDNQLHNEISNLILEVLDKNTTVTYINLYYNRIQLKKIDEINKILRTNAEKQKLKFVPNLITSVKNLEFNPNQFEVLTTKIKEKKREQKFLFQKVKEEDKEYCSVINGKQKDLNKKLNKLNNIKIQIQNIEKNINNIDKEIEIEEKNFISTMAKLKEKIFEEKNLLIDTKTKLTYVKQDYENAKRENQDILAITKEKFNLSQKALKKIQNSLNLINNEYIDKEKLYQKLIEINFVRSNHKKRKTYLNKETSNFKERSGSSFKTFKSSIKMNLTRFLTNIINEKEKKLDLSIIVKEKKNKMKNKFSHDKYGYKSKSNKKYIKKKADTSALLFFPKHNISNNINK